MSHEENSLLDSETSSTVVVSLNSPIHYDNNFIKFIFHNNEDRFYIEDNVLPSLIPSLMQLLKRIEKRNENGNEKETEFEDSVNDTIFLGQKLMRNNVNLMKFEDIPFTYSRMLKEHTNNMRHHFIHIKNEREERAILEKERKKQKRKIEMIRMMQNERDRMMKNRAETEKLKRDVLKGILSEIKRKELEEIERKKLIELEKKKKEEEKRRLEEMKREEELKKQEEIQKIIEKKRKEEEELMKKEEERIKREEEKLKNELLKKEEEDKTKMSEAILEEKRKTIQRTKKMRLERLLLKLEDFAKENNNVIEIGDDELLNEKKVKEICNKVKDIIENNLKLILDEFNNADNNLNIKLYFQEDEKNWLEDENNWNKEKEEKNVKTEFVDMNIFDLKQTDKIFLKFRTSITNGEFSETDKSNFRLINEKVAKSVHTLFLKDKIKKLNDFFNKASEIKKINKDGEGADGNSNNKNKTKTSQSIADKNADRNIKKVYKTVLDSMIDMFGNNTGGFISHSQGKKKDNDEDDEDDEGDESEDEGEDEDEDEDEDEEEEGEEEEDPKVVVSRNSKFVKKVDGKYKFNNGEDGEDGENKENENEGQDRNGGENGNGDLENSKDKIKNLTDLEKKENIRKFVFKNMRDEEISNMFIESDKKLTDEQLELQNKLFNQVQKRVKKLEFRNSMRNIADSSLKWLKNTVDAKNAFLAIRDEKDNFKLLNLNGDENEEEGENEKGDSIKKEVAKKGFTICSAFDDGDVGDSILKKNINIGDDSKENNEKDLEIKNRKRRSDSIQLAYDQKKIIENEKELTAPILDKNGEVLAIMHLEGKKDGLTDRVRENFKTTAGIVQQSVDYAMDNGNGKWRKKRKKGGGMSSISERKNTSRKNRRSKVLRNKRRKKKKSGNTTTVSGSNNGAGSSVSKKRKKKAKKVYEMKLKKNFNINSKLEIEKMVINTETFFLKKLLVKCRKDIQELSASHIAELIGYNTPPKGVWRVLKSSLYLFDYKKSQMKTWNLTRSIVKKLNYFELLKQFDPTKKQKVRKFKNIKILLKNYTYEKMRKTSLPAKILFAFMIVVLDLREQAVKLRREEKKKKEQEKEEDDEMEKEEEE